jgi:hypothetical protein
MKRLQETIKYEYNGKEKMQSFIRYTDGARFFIKDNGKYIENPVVRVFEDRIVTLGTDGIKEFKFGKEYETQEGIYKIELLDKDEKQKEKEEIIFE